MTIGRRRACPTATGVELWLAGAGHSGLAWFGFPGMSPRYLALVRRSFRGELEARLAEFGSPPLALFSRARSLPLRISSSERHSHKVGDIARLHLLNDSGSVVFGRPRADAQLTRDGAWSATLQKKGEDLLLALRQQGLPGAR